ncbi:competence protein ComQ [Sporosarcina luteola]|nr:competence protein ComQ [Sporosarcina luteola]
MKWRAGIKSNIQLFMKEYLLASDLPEEIQKDTFRFLTLEGKLFNEQKHFTWGEFSYYIFSLFDCEDQSKITARAAGIELLILSTDIIDDLIDNDYCSETFTILSKSEALLLSNALLMESISLLVINIDQINPLKDIRKNLINACNGQWQDLYFTIDIPTVTEEQYFHLIKQKSASLFRLIFDLNSKKDETLFEQISTFLGYSGQIRNDVKDIFSENKNDLKQKKATLPVIKALEHSIEKDDGFLLKKLNLISAKNEDSHLLNEISTYINKTGAISYCLILAKLYENKAKALITQCFPNKEIELECLLALLD